MFNMQLQEVYNIEIRSDGRISSFMTVAGICAGNMNPTSYLVAANVKNI